MRDMKIDSYYISYSYGYGYYANGSFTGTTWIKNPNTDKFESYDINPKFRDINIGNNKLIKMFIVSDGESWYEYLTGLPIDCKTYVTGFSSLNHYFLGNHIFGNFTVLINIGPSLSMQVNATQFADELKNYDENERKLIAEEIRKYIAHAKQWNVNYTEFYNKLQHNWENDKSSAENSIGSKFGNY